MAGERRVDRHTDRFAVADLPDHDDVRVMPQQGAQAGRKIQSGVQVDLNLVDAANALFNRVFHRANFNPDRVQDVQRAVKSRGLAAAGRTGHQHHAIRLFDVALD